MYIRTVRRPGQCKGGRACAVACLFCLFSVLKLKLEQAIQKIKVEEIIKAIDRSNINKTVSFDY